MNLESVWPDVERLASTREPADMMSAVQLLIMAAFDGQRRYDGLSPMWVHSTRVGLQIDRWGGDISTTLAGFGHDLLEDTDVTPEQLEMLFGGQTLAVIQACTLDDAIYQLNHQNGNDDLYRRVRANGERAVLVEVADIDDNLATFDGVPEEWQREMWYCAEWRLELGRSFLGVTHPGVVSLHQKMQSISQGR